MSAPPESRSPLRWLTPVAVVAVALALVVIVLALNREDSAPEQAADPAGGSAPAAPTAVEEPSQPDLTALERRDEGDLLAAGPADAPVGLVVFSDYQCPYCARWSEETLPVLMERVEAGELRIEWRDVNVFGPASERAARASYAAAEQGRFWEYHDELFADGEVRPEGELSDEALTALAGDLGLDTDQFAADLASEETATVVGGNAQSGLEIGVYSTPAFILGGQPIMGAQPTEVFVDAFDRALAGAR